MAGSPLLTRYPAGPLIIPFLFVVCAQLLNHNTIMLNIFFEEGEGRVLER
jgi:hypothetical protein